jgi:hypothetical protein
MFDGIEILEQLIYQSDTADFLSGCETVRNPSRIASSSATRIHPSVDGEVHGVAAPAALTQLVLESTSHDVPDGIDECLGGDVLTDRGMSQEVESRQGFAAGEHEREQRCRRLWDGPESATRVRRVCVNACLW